MIVFLGNCQSEFLANSVQSGGGAVSVVTLASPETMINPARRPPAKLAKLVQQCELEGHLHGRDLDVQFGQLGAAVKNATLIVMNLFHETSPLHKIEATGEVFYIDPAAARSEEFGKFLEEECQPYEPDPSAYLDRFGKMLVLVREQAPGVPILLLTRLSHYPAFGPTPVSYLKDWGRLWPNAGAHYDQWAEDISDFHVLDMDRVFAGVWKNSERRIEEHCPFLKIEPVQVGGGQSRLILQRDLEHVGTVWSALADKVLAFQKTGRLAYGPDENVPQEWRERNFRPERLTADRLKELLSSGANYFAARAVAAFFVELSRDYTELLVACRHEMPICHNMLHMIRAYAALRQNPRLEIWLQAHQEKAEKFLDNGDAFQQQYLQRLQELRELIKR
jgi:hypothetical protein